MEIWDEYVQDVASGRQIACAYVRQAVERYRTMLSDGRFEFRIQAVRKVVSFFALLRHFQGSHAGKRFVLAPWQQFIIAAIYGFYWKGTRTRVVTSVYIEMARKQGKTAFAAGLALYHMMADGEPAAEVYLAANSKEQAKIAYSFCKAFAKGLDPKQQMLRIYRDSITFDATNSQMRVLAADSTKLDGPNPSMYLLDEYHAARDTSLKDVLQSGQGMRDNPMQIIITTAGFDKLGPCYEMRTTCTEILQGIKEDWSLFAIIYTIDDTDDWKSPDVWQKSNPNLGVTVKPKYIEDQIQKALNSPSEEVGVRTKNINQWCDAEEVWIPDRYILQSTLKYDASFFSGQEIFVGIDLSATTDLTAVGFMMPREDEDMMRLYFYLRYYLPEAALSANRFKELYGAWRRLGCLTITPGNVTDYDYILNDIMDMQRVHGCYINAVGYDSWNATQFAIDATQAGLPMQPFSQSIGNFNKPTKELERLILSDRVRFDGNVITRHCFRNVVMARDNNGNTKPSKKFVEKKIDGVITVIEALGVWLSSPRFGDFY